MDVAVLQRLQDEQASAVPLAMLTVFNNFSGGQPVSLANIQAVRELCDRSRSSSDLQDQQWRVGSDPQIRRLGR